MSANQNIESWKAEFTLPKKLITPLTEDINWPYDLSSPPTLSCFEIAGSDNWLVEVFSYLKPSKADCEKISKFLSSLINQELGILNFTIIEAQDWVSESQKLQKPIKIGRFLCHANHHDNLTKYIDDNTIKIEMDAGQAFGTGEHETTSGCLEAIDNLANKISPKNILDLGTGTGLLAIAAYKLWQTPTLATDNDPKAIEVAEQNIEINKITKVSIGDNSGVSLLLSEGFNQANFNKIAKFDLIIANILAKPLIELASTMKNYATNDCTIILSGILNKQANGVINEYEANGFKLNSKHIYADWAVLMFS